MDANEANVSVSTAQSVTKEFPEEIEMSKANEIDATLKVNTAAQDSLVNKDTDLSHNTEIGKSELVTTEPMSDDTNAADEKQNTNVELETDNVENPSVKVNANATPSFNVGMETMKQPSADVISAGLTMLSQYDSDASESNENIGETVFEASAKNDSDVESVVEVVSNVNDYRSNVVELSSDSEDSSSSCSSSDSSTKEGEQKSTRSLKKLRKLIDKSIAAAGTDDEDEDDEIDENGVRKIKRRLPPKVKGELLLEDLPPIEDLHITVPEEECIELGRVHSIVDQLLLVSVLPNSLLLDLDTVLFLDKGKRVLGSVFDVLGPVAAPLYCIRFNSNAQIQEKQINVSDIVYVAPKTEHTQFVILSSLMKIRGSDASWENDVEPPQRFLDYSDDEQERQARARLRNKDRQEPAENDLRNKRSNNDNNDNDDASDTMSVMSDSTVASEQSTNRGHGRGSRTRGSRGRGNDRARGTSQYSAPPQMVPQMQGHMPQYAPTYDSGSWHSNFYAPQPYAYGGMPPPPPVAGMGYYQFIPPPYAYGPNYMPYPPPPHAPQQMQPIRPSMPRAPPPHQEHNE